MYPRLLSARSAQTLAALVFVGAALPALAQTTSGDLDFPPLLPPTDGNRAAPVLTPQAGDTSPDMTSPASTDAGEPALESTAPLDVVPEAAPGEMDADTADTANTVGAVHDVDGVHENELCHAQFFDGGTPQGAILHCTRALESGDLSEGDVVTALVNRGIAYKLNSQLDLAIEDYTQALSLSPESGDIYTTRANAYLEMARLDAAIGDANKALAFKPDYAPAYYVRGRIFEALGQKGFARDDFLRAYDLAPNNTDIQEKAWAYGANQQ